MKIVRILAVDDHEMTTMGYKYILEDVDFADFRVQVDTAKSFDDAKDRIERSLNSFRYDIALLDIQLEQSMDPDKPPKTGEDLGKIIRQISPETNIVFMSSYSDNYRINSILKSVDPEGYMVKTEIDQHTLIDMVRVVMSNPPYYTHKALAAIRKKMANEDLGLDELDKKIIYLLSIGTRTKDMVNHLPLSLPGIENRKRQLKALFGVEKQNDQTLITEARNRGFI